MAFHRARLEASHNRFVVQFGALLDEFFRSIQPRLRINPARSRRTLVEHRQMMAALRGGDVRKARRIMAKHLEQYWQMPPARRGGRVRAPSHKEKSS